jgi:hypothetical protein
MQGSGGREEGREILPKNLEAPLLMYLLEIKSSQARATNLQQIFTLTLTLLCVLASAGDETQGLARARQVLYL